MTLQVTGRLWRDDRGRSWSTYTLTGAAITDPEVLAQIDIPDHESCVEVGRRRKDEGNEAAAGPSV